MDLECSQNAIENGGRVRGINAKGQGAMPSKKIDKLVEFAKDYGAKGLAYIAIAGGRNSEIFFRQIHDR